MADPRTGTAGPTGPVGKQVSLSPDAIQVFLLKTALFSDAAIASSVATKLEVYEVGAGTHIIKAGSPGDSMGILARGKATVAAVNASTGDLSVVDSLRAGDPFGEIGPLLGAAQSHAVIADEPCVYLRMPAPVVKHLMGQVASFSHAVAKRLAMRVVQLGVVAIRGADAVAAAPTGGNDGPMGGKDMIPFVEIASFDPTPPILAMIPDRVIVEQRVIPLRMRGSTLTLGMVSPRNESAILELKRILRGIELDVVAVAQDDFQHALIQYKLVGTTDAQGRALTLSPDMLTFDAVDAEREADKAIRVIGDEVVRAVNRIICAAIDREASDIHIEPDASGVKVRFRVNGVLQDWNEYVAASFGKGIAARLKILSGLDITERRMPQDGRIAVNIGKREVDIRISTLPASRGEKIVMRLFEAAGMMRSLERTFQDKNLLSAVRQVLGRTTGAILVAGGTGSGKSSTLYSMITEQQKLRPDSNVVMVEDPIEYRMQGVTQVQVNHSIGLGFSQVLRSILRQDPDVITLGETRDAETARISLEAAMTGHLLLTSIHANDAMSTFQRLESLGCSRELMAQSVSLIMVQRLVRRLCPSCARAETPAPAMQESLAARRIIERAAQVKVPRAIGCDHCNKSGYAGRVAVIESIRVTEEVRGGLISNMPLNELEALAIKTQAMTPFYGFASYLLARNLISGADALMAVAG